MVFLDPLTRQERVKTPACVRYIQNPIPLTRSLENKHSAGMCVGGAEQRRKRGRDVERRQGKREDTMLQKLGGGRYNLFKLEFISVETGIRT